MRLSLRKIAEALGRGAAQKIELCDPGPMLIVAPHMDDDVLGCGGLLALRARTGLPGPAVIYLSDGTRGTPTLERDPSLNQGRKAEARKALAALGANDAGQVLLDLPDNEIKADKKTAGRLADELALARPEWILVNSPLDSHPDHRAASRLLAMALEEPKVKKNCGRGSAFTRSTPPCRFAGCWTSPRWRVKSGMPYGATGPNTCSTPTTSTSWA
jgi:LmbE family N-acetylglucosaminyl deacetylase